MHSIVKEVGCNVSSERCEIEGIILSLETVIESVSEGHGQSHNERVYILCDCQRTIDVFTVHSEITLRFGKEFYSYVIN